MVAAAHGGLTEIVRDGETGLLVPPGDAAALAAALCGALADDPGCARRLGEAAAAATRASASAASACSAELEAAYERLLAG